MKVGSSGPWDICPSAAAICCKRRVLWLRKEKSVGTGGIEGTDAPRLVRGRENFGRSCLIAFCDSAQYNGDMEIMPYADRSINCFRFSLRRRGNVVGEERPDWWDLWTYGTGSALACDDVLMSCDLNTGDRVRSQITFRCRHASHTVGVLAQTHVRGSRTPQLCADNVNCQSR